MVTSRQRALRRRDSLMNSLHERGWLVIEKPQPLRAAPAPVVYRGEFYEAESRLLHVEACYDPTLEPETVHVSLHWEWRDPETGEVDIWEGGGQLGPTLAYPRALFECTDQQVLLAQLWERAEVEEEVGRFGYDTESAEALASKSGLRGLLPLGALGNAASE